MFYRPSASYCCEKVNKLSRDIDSSSDSEFLIHSKHRKINKILNHLSFLLTFNVSKSFDNINVSKVQNRRSVNGHLYKVDWIFARTNPGMNAIANRTSCLVLHELDAQHGSRQLVVSTTYAPLSNF